MKRPIIICIIAVQLLACQSQKAPDPAQTTPSQTTEAPRPQAPTAEDASDQIEETGPASPQDAQSVREVYAQFKAAVLGYHGADATALLSTSSLKYYENLLIAARMKNHFPEEFKTRENSLSPSNRTTVALITRRLTKDFIDTATPAKLYETAFNQGWIGYKTISTSSIDNIRSFRKNGNPYIVGDFYYTGTLKDNLVLNIGFDFEDNTWKIDLVPVFVGLDRTIREFIENKNLDVDTSLDATVESSETSLEPAKWQPSIQKQDEFSAKFPRSPLYADNDGEHIYTSQHHKYGQFDVRVRTYSGDQTPFTEKALRDQTLKQFLKGLGAENPQCAYRLIGTDHMLQCDFTVPEHNGRGKSVWVFTPNRQYQLFNLAREDMYSDEAAAAFMSGFAYGLK